jgi:hypothetical protein
VATSPNPKYYKLKYQSPAKSWTTVNNDYWDKMNVPQSTDVNGLNTDIYSASYVQNIQNELKTLLPNVSGTGNKNYIFQFTGKAASAPTTIYSGAVSHNGYLPSQNSSLLTNYQTFSFPANNGILSMKTNLGSGTQTLSFYDYALNDRGYFLKDLTVTDTSGNVLPAMIVSGQSRQYLKEGQNFKVSTQLYDRDGTLKSIEVLVYLNTVTDANLVKYQYYDYSGLTSAGATINFNQTINGITDLTSGDKELRIVVRATDTSGNSTISSDWLRFVQFPSVGDFTINIAVDNMLVGQSPILGFLIHDAIPSTLRGLNLYVYSDANSPDQSDYNRTFYIDKDFSCYGFDCSFNFTPNDFILPRATRWTVLISALLTTQNEDINSNYTTAKKNLK